MLIDWFTIVAQIINFLILVFLLQRFLYGPIVRVMDEREERIFARLKEAEQREAAAAEEAQRYRDERAQLEERRRQLMVEAEAEADAKRKELLHAARQEADAMSRQWRNAIQQEKERFLNELRRRTTRQIYSVARRALAELADVELERQMVKVFLRHLREMDDDERRMLRPAGKDDDAPLVVHSVFELTESDRQQIERALHDLAGESAPVVFEIGNGVINGLELRSDSHSVAWNLAHYLRRLEEEIASLIEQETQKANEPTSESDMAGTVAA